MTNGNQISWKVLATVLGSLFLALFTWAASSTVDQVDANSSGIVDITTRVTLIERSQQDILDGQEDIKELLRRPE